MLKTNGRVRFLTSTALLAAFLAVLAPISLPIGPIPLTLALLALFLLSSVSSPSVAVTATAVYLFLGAVGLPVFSGFEGGFQKFIAPTGGFLWGYLPAAAIVSLFLKRFGHRRALCFLAMLLGLVPIYFFGALGYGLSLSVSPREALTVTVLPFLLPDVLKLVAASALGSLWQKRFGLVA